MVSLIGYFDEYASVMGRVSLDYLAAAILVYYLSVLLYALRWRLILRGMGKDAPLKELVKSFLASIFMNNVTPMSRSGGELLRIVWISRKSGIPFGVSTISVVYERILESIPVFVLILLGMTYFSVIPNFVFILGVVGIALIWIKWESFVKISLKIFRTSLDDMELERVLSLKRSPDVTVGGIFLSSLVWVLDVVRLKLITLAFGVRLGILLIVLVSVANLLLGLVAFTPGGVGIIEGGLVGTLTHFGVPLTLALSITLMERFVSYVLSTVVGFFVFTVSGGRELWRALKSR